MRAYSVYLQAEGAELFTAVCLPEEGEKFPTVLMRSPYVDDAQDKPDEEVTAAAAASQAHFTDAGYAVVVQHCRGRGRSSGDCVPYIYEREDGLALQEWVRQQDFYNGELYLVGGSYLSSVHYVTAPFAPDIRGAVLAVQDTERYNVIYRNGFFKCGLHGGWYVGMYKKKRIPKKNYVPESFLTLPLSDFSRTVLGEPSADFDEALRHPKADDPFWQTRFGGGEARDAVRHANIPILLVTGFYDIYTGGIFDMWNRMDETTRAQCALIVHPYDHGCNSTGGQPVRFEGATLTERFGDWQVCWLNWVRGKEEAPARPGQVTYYRLFGEEWRTDAFETSGKTLEFPLGEGERTYRYNPYAPARFPGGLSANFGGCAWQDGPDSRYDIVSLFTPAFAADTFVKGKMRARLRVRSSCEDTCFYIRLSLEKSEGYYGLRDDIQQISNFRPDYVPGQETELTFCFDEHAFTVKKGERLRIDISSSAFPHYVPHTNRRGLFSEQTTARIADNTVILGKSFLTVPAE